MFSTSEFQSWAKDNVVRFAAVMTKIDGREEDDLLRTYGFNSFPSLALLDAGGDTITKNVSRDLFGMSTTVVAATLHQKLQPMVEAGKKVDANDWFMARLGTGELKADEAETEMVSLKLNAKQRASAEQQILVMAMTDLARSAREDPKPAAVQVYKWFQDGKYPPAGSSMVPFYDAMLIEASKEAEDGKAFHYAYPRVKEGLVERVKSLEEMIPRYENDERMMGRLQSTIDDTKEKLAELDAQAETFKVKKAG